MNTTEVRGLLDELVGPLPEPIAVTFCDTIPAGIQRIGSAAPAGCSYWKLAAEGMVFYTTGEDHLNCPIGAYTHGADLPADARGQLAAVIGKMVGIHYLKMDEVAKIPRRTRTLRFVVYAPLSKAPVPPEVVLIRGSARQIMMITEAATACNVMSLLPVMGRPACAVIAATINTSRVTTSLGCIGNRLYTQLPDGEFYVAIPGLSLIELVEALRGIVSANCELEQYHRARCR